MAWARSLPQGYPRWFVPLFCALMIIGLVLFASGHIPQWISPVWMNFMSASCQMLSSRTLRCCVRAANIARWRWAGRDGFPNPALLRPGSESLPTSTGQAEMVPPNSALLRPGSESLPASTGRAETGSLNSALLRPGSESLPASTGRAEILYNSQLFTVLGKGITSRMLDIPVRYMTQRSKPRPKPA